jgi:hypothetical protein
MGAVYTSLGVYGTAAQLLERAVATKRRVLGNDHPDTIAAMNQLANVYWFQGKVEDAEPLYREVVERRRPVDHLPSDTDRGTWVVVNKAGQWLIAALRVYPAERASRR